MLLACWLPAACVLALDQLVKELLLAREASGRGRVLRTPGIAGGAIRDRRLALGLWIAASAGVAWVGLSPANPAGVRPLLGLALGGATGNTLDLVARGAVVDFVRLGRWPAFNLADAALVVGGGGAAALVALCALC